MVRESPVERVSRIPREHFPFSCALELDALFAVVEALRAAASSDRRLDASFFSLLLAITSCSVWFPSTPNAKLAVPLRSRSLGKVSIECIQIRRLRLASVHDNRENLAWRFTARDELGNFCTMGDYPYPGRPPRKMGSSQYLRDVAGWHVETGWQGRQHVGKGRSIWRARYCSKLRNVVFLQCEVAASRHANGPQSA